MENEKKDQRRRFEEIARDFTPRIFKMIYNMIEDYETTKDLTQDVFVNAWKGFSSFRGDASIYTWIYRIALNRVFRYRRKNARWKIISIDDIKPTGMKENPEKNFFKEADRALIRNTIQDLPENYQAVLILRYYEDNDYATIAKILGIPVGTVRSRLHRGISTLTNLIKERI